MALLPPPRGANTAPPIPPAIIAAAADWLVRLREDATPAEHAACLRWRNADPRHELAWQRLNGLSEQVQAQGASLGPAGTLALQRRPQPPARRQALKVLAGVGVLGVLGWQLQPAPWRRRWLAAHATGVGEQRRVALADGGWLLLNTASAVDIDYRADLRRVVLQAGEVLVQTAPDARPFVLESRAGQIVPLGTRFLVRETADAPATVAVAVLAGAVELQPAQAAAARQVVQAGEQAHLTADGVRGVAPLAASADSWAQGMLVADQQPLGDFVAELARYRPGLLRVEPAVAHLPVTGAFPLTDTDQALAMLTEVLPVALQRRTAYWVTVVPRE